MPVPVLACVMDNCGVRSRGESLRASVPSGGHRRGKGGWVNESEPLMRLRYRDPSWAKLVRSGSGLDRFEDLVDVVG
jgi:hypothetical protein